MYPVEFRFLTQNITVKQAKKKEKGFYVSGYASVHSIVDRQEEIVTKEALEKAVDGLLKDGSTLFFNHNYDQPIGKIEKATVDKKGLFIESYISKTRPDISGLIEEGILNKFSIGGKVIAAETVRNRQTGAEIIKILEMELYEVSLVGVPANAKAQVVDYVLKSAVQKATISDKEHLNSQEASEMKGKEKSIRDGIDKVIEEQVKDEVAAEEAAAVEEEIKEEETVKEEVKEEKKEEEVKEEEVKEEVKDEVKDEEVKEEKEEEVKEEVVEEKEKEEEEVKDEKQEEDVEDVVEKVSEEEVDMAKAMNDKLNDIHKAVLGNNQPRFTLLDKDVTEVIKDFDKLTIGDEIVLKVYCIVAEKAEAENANEENTYKFLTLRTVEAEKVGETKKKDEDSETTKHDEEKAEETKKARGEGQGNGGEPQGDGGADICECPECGTTIPHEKGVPCSDVKCPECGTVMQGKNKSTKAITKEDKGKRKGINTDNLNENEKTLSKKLNGKTVEEVMNDSTLYDSLDEETQKEVMYLYKSNFFTNRK